MIVILSGIVLLLHSVLIQPVQNDSIQNISRFGVKDAVSIAMKNNPEINQLETRIKAEGKSRWSAVGLSSPDLFYFREGIPEGSAHTTSPDFVEQRYGISQSLQFPLTSYYQYQKINYNFESLKKELQAKQALLKANVKKYYTNIALAIKLYQLSTVQVNLAKQIRDAVTTRYQVGETGQIDVLKAEIQLAEANNDLDDANKQLHDARYSLFFLIGLDPSRQSYDIEFTDTLRYFEYDLNQQTILNSIEHQPELRSLDDQLKSARSAIRQYRSSYLPDLGVSYYKQDYGNGYDFYGVQVSLKIPLWFLFNQNVSTQIAKTRYNEIGWARRSILLSLKKNVETTWHSYSNSLQTIRRYHQKIRSQSENMLQLTLEGYREGELDLLTLLDTQRTYLNSQRRYYEALHTYYMRLIEIEKFLHKDIVYNE
ncbi:MAG TPA: TolC family protein [Balneolales bacterium]|nr:TolC family protein [Balneolales bacterium]